MLIKSVMLRFRVVQKRSENRAQNWSRYILSENREAAATNQ